MESEESKMKNARQWGDPNSYSDRHVAQTTLRKPNKFICIRCLEQALTKEELHHKVGCPAGVK